MQLMKNQGMTQQEFSRASGISPASLSSIFTERTSPTMKHAEALHRSFPRLNVQWLLFGEGDMFLPDPEELVGSGADADGAEMDKSGGSDPDIAYGQSGMGGYPSNDGQVSGMGGMMPAAGGAMPAVGGGATGSSGVTTQGGAMGVPSDVRGAGGAMVRQGGMAAGVPAGGSMPGQGGNGAPLSRSRVRNNNVLPEGAGGVVEGASVDQLAGNADGRRYGMPYFGGFSDCQGIANFPDIKRRKIVEIRIFFDDGTFETFKGND